MDVNALKNLLARFRDGSVTEDEVLAELRDLPFEDMGFAKVDHHRTLRTGIPEVVYGEGKQVDDVLAIAERMVGKQTNFLVTRCSVEMGEALKARHADGTWDARSRLFYVEREARTHEGRVLVASAGTTDIPIAEEAAVTAALFGCEVDRVFDVGVAGVHRLMAHRDRLDNADVVIVAAGMEGALASVVAGMSRVPVIALPTSVGYGAAFNGLAALLGMLTSCAPGVTVVNIDNGFGAGCAAAMIVSSARNLARRMEES